jgi:hypothetical protein
MPRDLFAGVIDAATVALYPLLPMDVTFPATRRRVEAALSAAFPELTQMPAAPAVRPVERPAGADGCSGRAEPATRHSGGLCPQCRLDPIADGYSVCELCAFAPTRQP